MPDPAPANDASLDTDDQIHRLWRRGYDTLSIAQALSAARGFPYQPSPKIEEHEIANRLPDILKRYRQMMGGGR